MEKAPASPEKSEGPAHRDITLKSKEGGGGQSISVLPYTSQEIDDILSGAVQEREDSLARSRSRLLDRIVDEAQRAAEADIEGKIFVTELSKALGIDRSNIHKTIKRLKVKIYRIRMRSANERGVQVQIAVDEDGAAKVARFYSGELLEES